jgi:hypothetical protein
MSGDGSEVFEGRLPRMVRTQLGELVQENGAEILQDPRRVRAMLGDTIATARREINLISLALSEGVPDRLQALAGDPLRIRAEIAALTRQLERNHALHHDAAEWAVRSCAWSLGLDEAPERFEPAPALPEYNPPSPPAEPPSSPAPGEARPLAGGLSVPPPGSAAPNTAPEPPMPSQNDGRGWSWHGLGPLPVAAMAAAVVLVLIVIVAAVVRGSGDDATASGRTGRTSPATSGGPSTPSGPTSPTTGGRHHHSKPHHHVTTPPAPFTSGTLFAAAKPYFRPAQCFIPTPEEAPVATRTPDKELVKCGTGRFTATFWCKSSLPGLMKDRTLFFGDHQGAFRYLVGAPAGQRRAADGVERAYHHVNSNDPRVYWDSRRSLCAAEIQGNDDATMHDTIRFWREGRR